jgi:hypothetical protein
MPQCAFSGCDVEFILGSYLTKKYCSALCRKKARKKIHQKKHPEVYKKSNAKWKKAHPEYKTDPVKGKNRELLKRYGITIEQKELRIVDQNGRCANLRCQTTNPGKKGWHTDHNHETNQIRGELCGPCNISLGMAKDNAEILQGLIEYLKKWSQ